MEKLTKERIEQYASDPRMCNINDEIREMASILLAGMEQEPVAYMTYKGYLLHAGDPKVAEYSEPTPLYDAAQPLTDAERAELQEYRKAAGEPAAWMYDGERALPPPFILGPTDPSEYWKVEYQPLYTAPQPAPAVEAVQVVPDEIDENLIECMRFVQCMLEDYRDRNHGAAESWVRHIDSRMSDYTDAHGDDAYMILRSLRRAAMLQPVSNRDELNGVMPDYEGVDLTQRECFQAGKVRGLPKGWVAVPIEPTAEMYDAGDRQLATKQVWDAMLAAAPQQEQPNSWK